MGTEDKSKNPRNWYRQQRDKIRGRTNRERNQVSIEQFMNQMRER